MKKLAGVYLVIDPKREWSTLLEKLKAALEGGLNIVQVWNHWEDHVNKGAKRTFLEDVKQLCQPFDVPVLMHEDWKIAVDAHLDGVHFDEIPADFDQIAAILKDKVIGITVSNDIDKIKWADRQLLAYISFCSVFPSSSVDTCEIVRPENIRAARAITDLQLFLSGGMNPENMSQLEDVDFDGVAIISGILDAVDPTQAVKDYICAIQQKVR